MKAWPVLPMPVRTTTHVVAGSQQQQPDGHRGFRNNSENGQSVASHDVYMASITNPLMAPVPPGPPGRSPRGFGPHKPSSFSSCSRRPPPPMREVGTLSRSNSSASLGRQQQQHVYLPQGQDMGGSPSRFGPPRPPGPGSVRSASLLSVEDP